MDDDDMIGAPPQQVRLLSEFDPEHSHLRAEHGSDQYHRCARMACDCVDDLYTIAARQHDDIRTLNDEIGGLRRELGKDRETEDRLRREVAELEHLNGKLARILHTTANALHGGEMENGLWSWHDLADLCHAQREALARLTAALAGTVVPSGVDAAFVAARDALHVDGRPIMVPSGGAPSSTAADIMGAMPPVRHDG